MFVEEELNSNKRYINLRNGMFDLNTYSLMEHRPEFYSSIRIPLLMKKLNVLISLDFLINVLMVMKKL
ncbi:MAG: hypothetical protein ACLS8D_13870 [Clostridioides difficile]